MKKVLSLCALVVTACMTGSALAYSPCYYYSPRPQSSANDGGARSIFSYTPPANAINRGGSYGSYLASHGISY